MDSLRSMELQCKERVDLLEALRESREEAPETSAGARPENNGFRPPQGGSNRLIPSVYGEGSGTSGLSTFKEEEGRKSDERWNSRAARNENAWIGQGTIPAFNYPDIARPTPPLPPRPPLPATRSSERGSIRAAGIPQNTDSVYDKPLSPNPAPVLPKPSRTPSPEKRPRMKTTLRPSKDGKKSKSKESAKPQAASSKAAANAWDSISRSSGIGLGRTLHNQSNTSARLARSTESDPRRSSEDSVRRRSFLDPPTLPTHKSAVPPPSTDYAPIAPSNRPLLPNLSSEHSDTTLYTRNSYSSDMSAPPRRKLEQSLGSSSSQADQLSYRNEYPPPKPISKASITAAAVRPKSHEAPEIPIRRRSPQRDSHPLQPPIHRRPLPSKPSARLERQKKQSDDVSSSDSLDNDRKGRLAKSSPTPRKQAKSSDAASGKITPTSSDESSAEEQEGSLDSQLWEERVAYIKKNLPKGIDPFAARQILNEIVVSGDEVHWEDVAGLDAAKKALKEAVVYPFLRPDLFMGLREPARGMLLFGPPGTGKTMLARAVATESRSTFFAISASSLTSKWLGDSEKLVRALFGLARALAPSIIFVDEIDSLLSSRGGSSEHESTRRIKTEFLIQWSDLQRAAAGKELNAKEKKEGDASRVLVLAATNIPWAIDEAARRRFVRRQYIPLPENYVREKQLLNLLGHQKHNLSERDIHKLVELTDGKLS